MQSQSFAEEPARVALEGGSSDMHSGEEDRAEEGGMRLAAWVEEADSYLDAVDMGRPHAEDPRQRSARVISFRKAALLLGSDAVEGKHYAADLAIGREGGTELVLLDQEEGTGPDEAQTEGIDCVHP